MTYRPLSAARFILVVEKDASFQKLIDDDFFELFEESILVTVRLSTIRIYRNI